jgi:hypothetical protein
MTFQFKYCLICEDTRRELNRKTTLMGFYGIAPDVSIKLRQLGTPIERLTFVLIAAAVPPGEYVLKFRLIGPDEKVIAEGGPGDKFIARSAPRYQIAITVMGPLFTVGGLQRIEVTADDQPAFATTFEVTPGTPADFQTEE